VNHSQNIGKRERMERAAKRSIRRHEYINKQRKAAGLTPLLLRRSSSSN
jgi:hypothetical protein